jgi:hypothetical protein
MFCVGRAVVDTWSQCARRIGLTKDMRVYIAKLLWSVHKYDGVLTLKDRVCCDAFTITGGQVTSHCVDGRDLCTSGTIDDVMLRIDVTLRAIRTIDKWGVLLNETEVLWQETIDALKSILYKMPMPRPNLVLLSMDSKCGCSCIQRKLDTFGNAVEFTRNNVVVVKEARHILRFGKRVHRTGDGPDCANHVFLGANPTKTYLMFLT